MSLSHIVSPAEQDRDHQPSSTVIGCSDSNITFHLPVTSERTAIIQPSSRTFTTEDRTTGYGPQRYDKPIGSERNPSQIPPLFLFCFKETFLRSPGRPTVEGNFEQLILLPLTPEWCGYRCVPPCLVHVTLWMDPGTSVC